MSYFFEGFILPAAFIIAALLLFFTAIGIPVYYAGRAECNAKADAMRVVRTYGFFQGCMVEYAPGKLIGIKQFIVVEKK